MQVRRDIQGVRALAVLLVVANHLFPRVLSGGYIGVDIFFVLSGYLITGQILKLNSLPIGKAIRKFYASRIRRILPSALIVIFATIFVTFLILCPIEGLRVNQDGFWSVLFAANLWFNSVKLNYFGDPNAISSLQHFWSLAVEEQFYIFWPMLLLVTLRISRARVIALKLLLILLLCVSLFSAIVQSKDGVVTAYFATQTRVWELMAGALIALINPHLKNANVASLLKLASIAVIAITALIYTDHSGIPGLATIPVVLAAIGLIIPSEDTPALTIFFENEIVFYIGGISYVLYLWHWPLIAIWEKYQGVVLHGFQPLAILGVALILSILTHHLLENPIRYFEYLVVRSSLSIASGAILVTTAIGIIQWVKVAHGF